MFWHQTLYNRFVMTVLMYFCISPFCFLFNEVISWQKALSQAHLAIGALGILQNNGQPAPVIFVNVYSHDIQALLIKIIITLRIRLKHVLLDESDSRALPLGWTCLLLFPRIQSIVSIQKKNWQPPQSRTVQGWCKWRNNDDAIIYVRTSRLVN